MANVLIINGHQPYPFAPGALNGAFEARARAFFEGQGFAVRTTRVADGWDTDAEIESHRWADVVFVQFPCNWMGVSWRLKQYMDEVYTAGMDGRLCAGDGRSRTDPSTQYGSGGTLGGTRYMFSVTFNAPAESFGDPEQLFFEGRSVDDLLWPMHLNMRFFAAEPLPTFSCHDVMKNPQIEKDFARFDAHLTAAFAADEETHR